MNLRARTALGALVACALAICAFGAATAAASGGLTAVECVEKGPGHRFNTSHCLTNGSEGNFETVAIKPGVSKEVEGTDTREITETEHGLGDTEHPVTVAHLSAAGVNLTITCGKGNTTGGKIVNTEELGEMKVHTTEAVVTWSECHVSTESDLTKQCKVEGTAPVEPVGSIGTTKLTATTGPEHKVTIKAETEAVITKFKILKKPSTPNCFLPESGSDLSVTVTGEATGAANTKTHSHLTIKEPWPCIIGGTPPCGGLRVNGGKAALTETVTGFTKGNKEATVGATTETEIKETEA